GSDHGHQVAGAYRIVEERHGEGSCGGRGDAACRPVVEGDRVVAGRRIEAKAVDGERGRVGGQAGRAAGHDRLDRGHLHCRATAHVVGGDGGQQVAGGWRGGERHGERSRGRGGDGTGRAEVEDGGVVAGRRIETETVDGERGR